MAPNSNWLFSILTLLNSQQIACDVCWSGDENNSFNKEILLTLKFMLSPLLAESWLC